MRDETLLQITFLHPADFSNYRGGNAFTFQNKVYRRHEEKLGSGAYGETFCFEADDHTQVVMKTESQFRGHYFFGKEFQQEAMWYQKVYGLGVFSGDPKNYHTPHHILMPYFSGKTLYDNTFRTEKELFFSWIKTANALQCLHDKHLCVHCDLKSDNIIVGNRADQKSFSAHDTEAFLIDFGFMTKVNQERNTPISDTKENKLHYRQYAPEIFTCKKSGVLAQTSQDIYSLGILLQDIYWKFLSDNNLNQFTSNTSDTVCDIKFNLTKDDPKQRWSIAKAIYMLVVTFFSHVPRLDWIMAANESELNKLNYTSLMQGVWRAASYVAIQVRHDKLRIEQKQLEKKGETSHRKQQKMGGLKLLQSDIQIKDPALLRTMISDAKKQFPDLTAGIFSRRTEILLDELMRLTPVFH